LRKVGNDLFGYDFTPRPKRIGPIDAIRNLASEPRPHSCLKLTGRDGWRIRSGNYRVIYEIEDPQQLITILHVGHRRDVYR